MEEIPENDIHIFNKKLIESENERSSEEKEKFKKTMELVKDNYPKVYEQHKRKSKKIELLDESFYKKVKLFLDANDIELDEVGIVQNANFCKIVCDKINYKLDPFEVLTLYDFITDVLQGKYSKIAINVDKDERIIYAKKLLKSNYIPNSTANLTDEEIEFLAFCIVYSFFTYTLNEEINEMEQGISEFSSLERIEQIYHNYKEQFPFKFYESEKNIGNVTKEYGRDINNPIKLKSIDDIYYYLDNICIKNDIEEDIKYERVGSFSTNTFSNIDKYIIYNSSNSKVDEFYFWGYAKENDVNIPAYLSEDINSQLSYNYLKVPSGYKIKIRKNIKIDWGNGIPTYNSEDLMSRREILDFGIQIITNQLIQDGFYPTGINNSLVSFPNIYAEKNNNQYAIIVEADEVHNQPNLSDSTLQKMETLKEHNLIPLYASVGIGAANPERFNRKLTLIGDEYYINFVGFESLDS